MGAPLVPVPRHPGIYRRGSRYAVRYTKPDGQPGQRSARTLAEARKLKATLTADVARGEYRETSTITLAAYAATWARTYKGRTGRGIRPQTLAEYEADLRLHVLPRLGHMRLTAITPQDIKLLAHELERSGRRRRARAPACLRLRSETPSRRFGPC